MSKKYENKSINAELVAVQFDIDIQKRNGGTYKGTKIIYNAFGKINEKAFTTKTFEFKPDLRGQLESLSSGDKFTLNLYREEGAQFWNVDSVTKGHTEQQRPSPSANASQGSASFGGPNQAELGQAINLAVHLGLAKKPNDLLNREVAIEAITMLKGAKELFEELWDFSEQSNEQNQQAAQSHSEPAGDFDDDIPF